MTTGLDTLLDRLEELLAVVDDLDEQAKEPVFELLDGIDELHRAAVHRMAAGLDDAEVERLRKADPLVEWLWEAYGVGQDERTVAEAALDTVRPYVHSHGGSVELLDARDGVVRVRMAGSCSGCSASAVTLTHGVEEALRRDLPGFVAVEVEEDETAEPHAPPGETLLQIGGPRR